MVDIGPMKLRRKCPRSRHGIRLLLGRRKPSAPTGISPAPIRDGNNEQSDARSSEPLRVLMGDHKGSDARSSELLRVLSGEITEQEYLAGRVEQALLHVKGRVSKERLEAIRQTLLVKLETDPVLLHARARVFRRDGDGD